MKKILLFMLPLLVFINCELFDDTDAQEKSNIDYPTTLTPLSGTELNELELKLDSLSNSQYKVALDEYGFIGSAGTLNRGSSSISNADIAIVEAKDAIARFTEFINVTDTSQLIISEATNQHGTDLFNDWIVSFQNQSYDNIEVLNTGIMVLITDNIIQITGHHYTDIVIPEDDLVSLEDAEESVIGLELTYYGWADIDTFVVDENALHVDNANEEATIKIFPFDNDDNIELRVCWRIPIFWGSLYPGFYIFVDILSKEMITYQTLFIS